MSETWSADRIVDDTYRSKFIGVSNTIADWLRDHGGLAGRDVLDFGCGEATAALAIALRHGARRVVGVEIHGEIENALPYARAQLGLERLPENLELIRLGPDSPLDPIGTFDVVYSWSVFEHVSQHLIVDSFSKLKRVLRPNGVMFLQTTPLFYSAEGSHMKPWVPIPWAHLAMQQDLFYAALRARTDTSDQADHLQWVYETLNRATAPQLLRAAKQAGFEVVREYRTLDEVPVPEELKEIYKEDVLTTNQLVLLARHAVPAMDFELKEKEGGTSQVPQSSEPTGPGADGDRAQKVADVLQRHESLRVSLYEAQVNLTNAGKRISGIERELAAMRASRSWRVTKPLRVAKQHLRRAISRFARNNSQTKRTG